MRVLLVEDSVLLQQALGTALQRSGYAVDISTQIKKQNPNKK
jgi:DNA-binding response OmpR family regulator